VGFSFLGPSFFATVLVGKFAREWVKSFGESLAMKIPGRKIEAKGKSHDHFDEDARHAAGDR
jgi:hypothetical protein